MQAKNQGGNAVQPSRATLGEGQAKSSPWLIFREDLNVWFPCIRQEWLAIAQNAQLTWRLQPAGQDGLQQLVGLGQGVIPGIDTSSPASSN